MTASGASPLGPIPYLKRASLRTFDHTFKPAVLFGDSLVVGQELGQPTPGSRAALHLCCHSRCASPTGRACPWWGTKRPTKLSPTSLKQSEQNQSLLMEPKALEKSARRVRACSTYPSRSHPAPGNGKTARESARQIPACSRLSQEPKARWRPGSADPTAPEQVSQMAGLREFRLAESEQILPPAGNRKLASDRVQWIQPVPCSSQAQVVPWRERGDRQSSVQADPTPSRAQPTGRRIRGVRLQNRGASATARRATHTLSRN